MSVLLRALADLGHERIGAVQGPHWVRAVEDGERTLAQLTDGGRAVAMCLPAPDDSARSGSDAA